jgi:hypothetical protein
MGKVVLFIVISAIVLGYSIVKKILMSAFRAFRDLFCYYLDV